MKVILDTQKEVVVVKEIKKTITELTILELKDSPEQKKVQAFVQELGLVTLWQGEEYDAIGQWTDQDVINKIKSL